MPRTFATVLVHWFPRVLAAKVSSVAVTVKEATAERADAIDQRRGRPMVAEEEVASALLDLVLSGPS